MAFENTEPVILSACTDCVYFNEYGQLDDMTVMDNPGATREHIARIAEMAWPHGTEFVNGGGREYEGEEPWFSWTPCEQCGSHLGGDREYVTAFVPVDAPTPA